MDYFQQWRVIVRAAVEPGVIRGDITAFQPDVEAGELPRVVVGDTFRFAGLPEAIRNPGFSSLPARAIPLRVAIENYSQEQH